MQIQFGNPVSYLGYLYHLEHLLTEHGRHYLAALKSMGIPESAMTFVMDHSTVDVGHNNLMSKYIDELLESPEDVDDVIYSAKSSCELHGRLISRGFENGGRLYASIA